MQGTDRQGTDRQERLRTVIDLLPLGKRQKALAMESIDSMSADEKSDMLALCDQTISHLPAALEAVRRLRGIAPIVQVADPSPSDTEQ